MVIYGADNTASLGADKWRVLPYLSTGVKTGPSNHYADQYFALHLPPALSIEAITVLGIYEDFAPVIVGNCIAAVTQDSVLSPRVYGSRL